MIRELVTIQYLRAVAALMIVLHHLPVQLQRIGYDGHWPEVFNSRVDIFFVISGFIIWVTTSGRDTSPKAFLVKRLVRIVPLYWLVTAFCVGVMLCVPGAMQSAAFNPAHVLGSFLFWPVAHPVTGFIAPVIVPAWTLLYEMAFYALFALCLPLTPKVRLAVLGLVLALAVSSQPLFPVRATVGGFYTSSIILEFAFGAAVGALFVSGFRLPALVSVLLIAGGCFGLAIGPDVEHLAGRAVYYGVPAALILTGAVFLERQRAIARVRPLILLGDASYALFLTHGIVLSVLGQFWRKIPALQGRYALFVGVSVVLIIAVAGLVRAVVEKPIASALRRRFAESAPKGVPKSASLKAASSKGGQMSVLPTG